MYLYLVFQIYVIHPNGTNASQMYAIVSQHKLNKFVNSSHLSIKHYDNWNPHWIHLMLHLNINSNHSIIDELITNPNDTPNNHLNFFPFIIQPL